MVSTCQTFLCLRKETLEDVSFVLSCWQALMEPQNGMWFNAMVKSEVFLAQFCNPDT
jgi:hypothetical protein